MVWSVFCWHGTGRLYIVDGTIRQDQYIRVLQTKLVPQITEWYPDWDFTFMQDGAPCHKARKVMTFLEGSGIDVLPWPGNSPDLNPIENLWAIVKKKLKKIKITTKAQLIESLLQIWQNDEGIKNVCQNLINSMPTRIREVIKRKGMHIKY